MITSTSNAKVKYLVNLKKKRKIRDEERVFLVEGIRMFVETPKDKLLEVYVSESFYKKEKKTVEQVLKGSGAKMEIFSDTVFSYVSDTKTPQGVLCVVRQMNYSLNDIIKTGSIEPQLLVLDNLQDPGNLGTILRTAEGAGVTGIVMSKETVDIYNPKVIRSTMGSVYRMPFYYAPDLLEAVNELKANGIQTYAAHLDGKHAYDEEDYKGACAFFIGNEGNGLRDEIADAADKYIRIPMCG
ncbi:MAG: TrmH family RNA methyltransferase, partial [Dorea sp.]